MVKNALKKSVSILFCVAILASFFMVSPAKADDPWRVEIYRGMSREECWMEAASHLATGLSRERIAVEIYALSHIKDSAYKVELTAALGTGAICVAGILDPEVVSKTAATSACVVGVAEILGRFGTVNDYVWGEPVKIGNASEKKVNFYYDLWNRVGEPFTSYANDLHVGKITTYAGGEKNKTLYSALGDDKVVDISNNSNANGTKVQLWSSNGTSAQRFYILHTGEGNWCNIFKAGTFKCLDVTGGKPDKGVNVQLWGYNGTAAQDWELVPVKGKDKYFRLRSRLGEYYLDACGGVSADGTQLWTWTSNETTAQQWKIE